MYEQTEQNRQALIDFYDAIEEACDKAMASLDPNGEYKPHFEDDKAKVLSGNPKCVFCGKRIDSSLSFPNPRSGTIHFEIPLLQGGKVHTDNMRPAHLECKNKYAPGNLFRAV